MTNPARGSAPASPNPAAAVIFDLDGVLTDTAELHYRSWGHITAEYGIAFEPRFKDLLRGLGRSESLDVILGDRRDEFSEPRRREICDRKNVEYLRQVESLTPADVLPGAGELLRALRERGVPTALASSSRNAEAVVERLEIRGLLDALVDGNLAERSKPDPQVFLLAAERLGAEPRRCVVVEDAESGVAAARAAGMHVVGVGDAARLRRADRVVASLTEVSVDELLSLARR